MNASCFAFRDINRNGVYDQGDRPMANVAFVGRNDRGWSHLMRSNPSGFANYRMSLTNRECEIVEPGLYTFELIVPPGWSVTTGNAFQGRRFRGLIGAPGDLVMESLPRPIGLAPDLAIQGRVEDLGPLTVVIQGPEGQEAAAELEGPGAFSVPVTPGAWRIAVSGSGNTFQRTIEVGLAAPVALSAIRLGREDPPPAGPDRTLGFDDLVSTGVLELPNGYGGLNWFNWIATHQMNYQGEGYINGCMSGEFVAYNSSGHPAVISSDQPFDFVGGHLTGAWLTVEGEIVRAKGWRRDELVYEDALPLSAMGPVYFAADYRGVTRVEFATDHYWQVVVDDMTFRLPS